MQGACAGGKLVTLTNESLEWAVDYVADHSDGDLFPRITEMEAIVARKSEFAAQIAGKPLSQFPPGAHRRFIVPKDEVSYRQATQLDPQDSIILGAIAYQYGLGIENRRRSRNQIFSYRFKPSKSQGLYDSKSSWNDFWTAAARFGMKAESVLYCDISDFYNQIYHHTVENQLTESGFSNQATKWVISLLESTTAGVSRGVPIGPHAAHLIAEASMIPIDNSMATSGLKFMRYADDIVVFCSSLRAAKQALSRLADILDKQQRLHLQRHKTKFFSKREFREYCEAMIEDRPISEDEDRLLAIVRKYAHGNAYTTISYNQIKDKDWAALDGSLISDIIQEYIDKSPIDYIRLRWFYRRLGQIGHPGAIDISLDNIDTLSPCFASICSYIASVQTISPKKWKEVGSRLLKLLKLEEVKANEYFRLSILSLFSRNAHINHFERLAKLYRGSDPFAKREILLAGKMNVAIDWLREFKEGFESMDPWLKMAFLYCCREFPDDERKYFVNRWTFCRPLDIELGKWAKSK